MLKKIAALSAAAVLGAGLMTGCGATAATDTGYSAENPLVLTLAHGLSETHTVHIAMTQFAEEVNEKTNGRIQVKIFPNGQLGSENENLEQLQAGVIAMTKVSAPGLATYNEAYNAFGLPYIFEDTQDFYHVMDSQEMQDFFLSTGEEGCFATIADMKSRCRTNARSADLLIFQAFMRGRSRQRAFFPGSSRRPGFSGWMPIRQGPREAMRKFSRPLPMRKRIF